MEILSKNDGNLVKEVEEVLLEGGESVNDRWGEFWVTPLLEATNQENLEVIKVLLLNGAYRSMFVKNSHGEDPIKLSLKRNSAEILEILLISANKVFEKEFKYRLCSVKINVAMSIKKKKFRIRDGFKTE